MQPAAKIAVAVLPFHALAVSQEARFLGVGIPDAIITRLAGLQQLIPRAYQRGFSAKTSPSTPRSRQGAGERLRAHWNPPGSQRAASCQRSAGPRAGRSAGVGDHYDLSRVRSPLTLQDQIAQSVADALKIQMTAAERERLFRRYTGERHAAYERYLRGRAQFSRYSAESLRAGRRYFRRSVEARSKLMRRRVPAWRWRPRSWGFWFAPASESRGWNERAERRGAGRVADRSTARRGSRGAGRGVSRG